MEVTSELVSSLRSKFLQKLEEEHGYTTSNSFHPHDMDRILKSDDWLGRFLIHHDNDVKNALNMVWETCLWRKEHDINEINERSVNIDYLEDGSMFVHNRDKDGKLLFIFKCKNHAKGQKDFEQLKRCVIYWFEWIERSEKCPMITIFFDMQDTGLSNMDMEFTKFLIGLCKSYYPHFLNYILIFEMPWILNAAFLLIKSWLPPKGVQKIKFVQKNNITEYIDPDQALTSWGGNDDYVFRFTPEFYNFSSGYISESVKTEDFKKKVHFADGSPLVEGPPSGFGDMRVEDNFQNVLLNVMPSDSVVFSEGRHLELSGVVKLTNVNNSMVTFKIKTTSPEKFRVRPSFGLLQPSGSVSINVSVQPGFTANSIFRDKFLIMSCCTDLQSPSQAELSELWKAADFKKISQHRLKCSVVSHSHSIQNGSPFNVSLQSHAYESDGDQKISQLISAVNHMTECNEKILTQVSYVNLLEKVIIVLVILLAVAIYLVYMKLPPYYTSSSLPQYYSSINSEGHHLHPSCRNEESSIVHEGYIPD